MPELEKLFELLFNDEFISATLSNSNNPEEASKCSIRPVLIKGERFFQMTLTRGPQVFHSNLTGEEAGEKSVDYMSRLFKQAQIKTTSQEISVLVSKKGKVTIKKRQVAGKAADAKALSHNREKQYILQDGKPVDFLVGLGVQTPDGKVSKNYYDKFRQINRYLEFIEDVCDKLPKDGPIRIVDFGCGKSYLTFAMYYYLHELQGRDLKVTGLDLKKDVIKHCNELAQKLHYDNLTFEVGDIQNYTGEDAVDMVVTLHACDKATDYALEKAVNWGASVIMAVPCCQHELNNQIKCAELEPVLKYGIIKERMAALVTDALRADLLEQKGYDAQILEFIDMEHTPKNLLIRAVKADGAGKMKRKSQSSDIEGVTSLLHVDPTLQRLLS